MEVPFNPFYTVQPSRGAIARFRRQMGENDDKGLAAERRALIGSLISAKAAKRQPGEKLNALDLRHAAPRQGRNPSRRAHSPLDIGGGLGSKPVVAPGGARRCAPFH
jgi:hypothetical protein